MEFIKIHFGPEGNRIFVKGMVYDDSAISREQALATIESDLKHFIAIQEAKDSIYVRSSITSASQTLYSIQNPTEINRKGEALLKFQKLPAIISTGYWIDEIRTGEHFVNIKPTVINE